MFYLISWSDVPQLAQNLSDLSPHFLQLGHVIVLRFKHIYKILNKVILRHINPRVP